MTTPPPIRSTEELVSAAVAELAVAEARSLGSDGATAPSCAGLYAIHAQAAVWVELGLGKPPDRRPLYVGKSESSLAGRDVTTHFGFTGVKRATSATGYSTVRRSLAALLHDVKGYRGVPRNRVTPGYYSNYGLVPEQDDDLSAWMRERLRLACWPKPHACTLDQLKCVERTGDCSRL